MVHPDKEKGEVGKSGRKSSHGSETEKRRVGIFDSWKHPLGPWMAPLATWRNPVRLGHNRQNLDHRLVITWSSLGYHIALCHQVSDWERPLESWGKRLAAGVPHLG